MSLCKNILVLCCLAFASVNVTMLHAQDETEIPDEYMRIDSVYALTFSNPVMAERIIAKAEQEELLDSYDLAILKGDFYINCGRLSEASTALGEGLRLAHLKNDTLALKEMYYRFSLINSAYNEVQANFLYLDSLKVLAEETQDYMMQSYVLSSIALHMFSQGDRDGGLQMMHDAIELGKKVDPEENFTILPTIYEECGSLCGMLLEDDRLDEAVVALEESRQALDRCREAFPSEAEFMAINKHHLAQRALIMQKTGHVAEAQQAYDEWKKIQERSNGDYVICSYLAWAGKYAEAEAMTRNMLDECQQSEDTCSYEVDELLRARVIALRGLGRYQEMADTYDRLVRVIDAIKLREQRSATQEYAIKYNTQHTQLKYESQRADAEAAKVQNQKLWIYLTLLLLVIIVIGTVALVRRVRHRAELKTTRRLAEIDFLTKILNRFGGNAAVDLQLELHRPGVFYLLDCDKFKSINDCYGHGQGDEVLIEVAKALRETFPRGIAIRMGGDEFALYLTDIDVSDSEQIRAAMQPFFDRISRIKLNGKLLESAHDARDFVSVSVGATIYDGSETYTTSRLYQEADAQLYQNKHRTDQRLMSVSLG